MRDSCAPASQRHGIRIEEPRLILGACKLPVAADEIELGSAQSIKRAQREPIPSLGIPLQNFGGTLALIEEAE